MMIKRGANIISHFKLDCKLIEIRGEKGISIKLTSIFMMETQFAGSWPVQTRVAS